MVFNSAQRSDTWETSSHMVGKGGCRESREAQSIRKKVYLWSGLRKEADKRKAFLTQASEGQADPAEPHRACLILSFNISVVCRRKGFRIRLSWIWTLPLLPLQFWSRYFSLFLSKVGLVLTLTIRPHLTFAHSTGSKNICQWNLHRRCNWHSQASQRREIAATGSSM